jgi:hypothetical protein
MTEFREVWLHNAVEKVSALLSERAEVEVPQVRVSAGWPSKGGTSTKKKVIGQCWAATASEDGVAQIFISPVLEDGVSVLATLTHELIHATHPGAKHAGDFIRTAKAVGLEKKWTECNAGEELTELLVNVSTELGIYPHSKISLSAPEAKPQTTRMLKAQCPVCEYTVRLTQKWVDMGMPSCPEGDLMELEVK